MNTPIMIGSAILALACVSKVFSNGEVSAVGRLSISLFKDTTTPAYLDSLARAVHYGKRVTIEVSYAAIECGCPQWFETQYQNVRFLNGIERFYLEPKKASLKNANKLWDGAHLPLTLRVTGRFSKEKALPITYHTKGQPEKARIFWYDKIVLVSR